MLKHTRFLLACLIALTAVGMATAAELGSISGTIVGPGGNPMRGVLVSAIDHDHEKSVTVLSDSRGQFVLDRLPAKTYDLRARLIGFEDNFLEEYDVAAGGSGDPVKFEMEHTEDILLQRTGASLFAEMDWDSEEERMSFKMSCTYCHQVGTFGFRTPEEPVDWEVMITRMDGFGALHKNLKKTIVGKLVDTYAEDAPERWAEYTPPEPPKGKALALRAVEWDMGEKRRTMIHDLELGTDGLVYAVDMANDCVVSLDPETGERNYYAVPGGGEPYTEAPMIMGPHSLECDAEGNMWITLAIGGKMGKFDTKTKEWTVVSGMPEPRPRGGYPHTLRIDDKGVVWFTDAGLGVLSLDPSADNARTFYKLPNNNQAIGTGVGESRGITPYGIDVAPNGHIWYTKLNGNRVGRIDPEVEGGDIKEWAPPFVGPRRLHVAPNGLVWVPGCGSGVFASFNPETEEWKVYDLPDKENRFPYALNIHPKTGDIWICGTCNDSMVRFIPETEEMIEYPMPSRVTYTREVEFAEDGSIWVCNSNWPNRHTERRRGSFIRISLDGTLDDSALAGDGDGD